MSEIIARWEWRTFGDEFGEAEDRINAHEAGKVRTSAEDYILSRKSMDNTKVRDMLMDIKTLRQVNEDKLEQWFPIMKAGFPLAPEIMKQVFQAWKVALPAFQRATYTYDEFLKELVAPHPDLRIVRVEKERHGFMINECIVEIANLKFDGKPIRTIAVEMEDPVKVMATVKELRLASFPNVNYLKALKRFAGM